MKTKKLFLAIILFAGMCIQANANTFTVNTSFGFGTGSLPWAIAQANATPGADFINIQLNGPGTIFIPVVLTITGDVTIQGFGYPISNNLPTTLFLIDSCNVTISGLNIIDAGLTGIEFYADSTKTLNVSNCAFSGADIRAIGCQSGTVNIDGCTFTGNTGGAIAMSQTSGAITNSTFSGNSHGGIFYAASTDPNHPTSLFITNCTISGNSNTNFGGGIISQSGPVTLSNTIVAGNSASLGGPDVNGGFTSQGHNFIGKSDGSTGFTNGVNNDQVGTIASPIDPMLGTLAGNCGSIQTMELLTSSPCLEAGSCVTATDQRGFTRPQGSACDIGAFEKAVVVAPTAYAGPNAGGCSNSSYNLLYQNATASNGLVFWSTSGNGIFQFIQSQTELQPLYFPGSNDIANGSVVLTLTVINGYGTCNISATSDFTLFICPVTAIINGTLHHNVTMCSPATSITFSNAVATGSTIAWHTEGDGTFNNASIQNPVYTPGPNDFAAGHVQISLSTDSACSFSNVTGSVSCTGIDSVTLFISQSPTPSISGTLSFCAGSSTTLNAGTHSGYNWSTGATTQTIAVSSAGTFTVTVTNASGCSGSTSAATSINQNPAPSISGTLSFCAGSSTTLNAETYSGYNWSTGATTQTIAVSSAGTFTVTVTNASGCTGSTFAATTVNPNPAPSISGTLSFCAGSSTTLNAGTYSGYNWSTGATTQTIAVSSAGTFTVTVTNANGCSGSTAAATTVNPNPAPSISGTNFLCAGGSTTLDAGSYAGYLWSTAATTQTISVNTSATYTVTVTNASGCTASTSRTLTHPPALTVDAGPNKIVYRGYPDSSCTKLQSSGVGGGVAPRTLLWSTGSTASFINVCPTTSTVYYLTVTDANGCTKKDSVKVCVIDVRCGSGNTKVTICHGTGSVSNPFLTLCLSQADVKWHILHHPGEKLGACGISRTCSFPGARLAGEEMQNTGEQENDLTAYPNPTSGEMNISFHSEEGGMYLLRVISITGQVLLSEMKQAAEGENKYTINLKGYAPGIYMVLLQSGDIMRQIRIVKE